LAVILLAGLLAACGRKSDFDVDAGPGAIRFAVLSVQSPQTLQRDWAPVIADMEAATGLKVRPYFSADYAATVQAMRDHKIDLAWLSNQAGLEAVRRAGGEVFARTADAPGAGGETAVLIASDKSRLTIERVLKCDKTLTLAMGDALSTASALAPETYLFAPRGIRPAACFRLVRVGNHGANLAAVAAGQVDVAASSSNFLRLERESGRRDAGLVRVIWQSPDLPQDPIIWRKDLDPAIKEKVRQFILTYGQGDGALAAAQRTKLAGLRIGGFAPADNTHLLPVREMEATRIWLDAKAKGDKARIDAARRGLDAIIAERQALEARTRAPAAAQ
jgi:phosphonate transport system substrate-binding protein